jgi:GT2 family glycosyltransferase
VFDITVVVPTYNRRKLLAAAVASLRQQTLSDRYEILIVSDGSTDGTDEDYREPLSRPLTRLVRQEKQGFGLSAARNLGIREAQGRLVLFLDDDMTADERMVQVHVDTHARFGDDVAVRGRVKPSPELPDTPFCQIVLGDVCRLYDDNTEQARFTDFGTAVSWQTSYKRAMLAELGGFDETFRCYGWEDIEFSYRASRAGLRFYYQPQAISYHNDQRQTMATHGQRLRNASRMAPVLFERHPELADRFPMYAHMSPLQWGTDGAGRGLLKVLRQLVATAPVLKTMECLTPAIERIIPWPPLLRRWYYGILGSYVLKGYREGFDPAGQQLAKV